MNHQAIHRPAPSLARCWRVCGVTLAASVSFAAAVPPHPPAQRVWWSYTYPQLPPPISVGHVNGPARLALGWATFMRLVSEFEHAAEGTGISFEEWLRLNGVIDPDLFRMLVHLYQQRAR